MKLIEHCQNWEAAKAAIAAGNFVRHAHWGTNRPMSQPDYEGPTAAGTDGPGRFAVYTDDGIKIHAWIPTPEELASCDWQVVDLARKPGSLLEMANRILIPSVTSEEITPMDPGIRARRRPSGP